MNTTPSNKLVTHCAQYSIIIEHKNIVILSILLLLLFLLTLFSLSAGSVSLPLTDVLQAINSQLFNPSTTSNAIADMVLFDIRLPRIMAVIIAGFGLGFAGYITQSVIRNQLATPDMIGINEGAMLAIVTYSLFISMNNLWPWWIAPIGGFAAFLLLYSLCRHPGKQGYSFIVIGIAIGELLKALSDFLLTTSLLNNVTNIYTWSLGSFIGQNQYASMITLLCICLVTPALFIFNRYLALLQLDEATATNLGLNVPRSQVLLIIIAIFITTFATSIGGPIAFIALASPVLANILLKQTISLWIPGTIGAILLLSSDTIIRLLAQPYEVPTGIITRAAGGAILLFILLRKQQ